MNKSPALLLLLLLLAACEPEPAPADAGGFDAAVADATLPSDGSFAALDSSSQAEAGATSDASSTFDASSVVDAGTSEASAGDASALDAANDAGPLDASPIDTSDAAVAAEACPSAVCCLPLTKAEGDAICQDQVCLAQNKMLSLVGSDGVKATNGCEGRHIITYDGANGTLSLQFDEGFVCTGKDAATIRAAIRKVYVVTSANDENSGSELNAVLYGPGAWVKELSFTGSHMQLTVEGPVSQASMTGSVSFACPGSVVPFGFCSCRFVGRGPVATIHVDLELTKPI